VASVHEPGSDAIFSTLRRFARNRRDVDTCELCSTEIGASHQHLIEPARRKLACACDACAIVFSQQGAATFKRVPRRIRSLPDFQLTDGQWDALAIPIGLAFFFHSSPLDKVIAFYPSPAGATESLLPLDTWSDLAAINLVLNQMEPDVEALLVNRVGQLRGSAPPAYYVAPIDVCYRLVGVIRTNWRGFSGGTEMWEEISRFFAGLDDAAEKVTKA
jgi:uncharacterized protein DUF5947